jgi:hypothetical protein
MYKLEKLKKDYPKELEEVVDILYADIYPILPKYKRSPKIYFRFNALGQKFDNKKATTNYIDFIILINKFLINPLYLNVWVNMLNHVCQNFHHQ